MHKNIQKILRGILIFGFFYLIFDTVLYFSNIRLSNVFSVWPESAVSYATLVNKAFGSFTFLTALIVFELQRNLSKYRNLVMLVAVWAFLHGVILLYLSLSNDYLKIFANSPSLYVWFPFYDQYLILEAVLLFVFSLVVFIWVKTE